MFHLPSTLGKKFENIIKNRRITPPNFNNRMEFCHILPEEFRRHGGFTGFHITGVPLESINFTVVSDITKGLSQGPGGKGVGTVPLMDQSQSGLKILIPQIRVKGQKLGGDKHPLIDHSPAGKGGYIVFLHVESRLKGFIFQTTAQNKKFTLQSFAVQALKGDKKLFKRGHNIPGQFTQTIGLNGNLSPAEEDSAFPANHLFSHPYRFGFLSGVLRHKEHSRSVLSLIGEFKIQNFSKKEIRNLNQHSRAVTGLLVSADSTPVFQIAEDLNSILNYGMVSFTVNPGNKPDTTGIMLLVRIVKASFFQHHPIS